MIKRHAILIMLCSCISAGNAYELREWEDIHGNRFAGRFVRELFGKLTVENDDRTQKTFSIKDLSDLDKKYIRVMVPPELEVSLRTQSRQLPRRPMSLWRDDDENEYWLVAEISKKSQRPFTSRLNLEVFLVADEHSSGNYILLGHFTDDFLLAENEDEIITYRSPRVRTTLFTETGTTKRKGEDYKGYIFIVTSQQEEQILLKSSLPKWMQEPAMLEKLRDLSVRGAASVRSRHFNKKGEKVSPPRPNYYPVNVH